MTCQGHIEIPDKLHGDLHDRTLRDDIAQGHLALDRRGRWGSLRFAGLEGEAPIQERLRRPAPLSENARDPSYLFVSIGGHRNDQPLSFAVRCWRLGNEPPVRGVPEAAAMLDDRADRLVVAVDPTDHRAHLAEPVAQL